MVDRLPEEVVQECKEAFSMFDRDSSGSISFDELASVMRILGNNPTDQELADMMNELDEDNSGQVDFTEFMKIVANHWKDPVDEENELKDAFKVFDRNNDGYVVPEEIKHVMKTLGHDLSEADLDDIMKDADVDGDGRLDYEEFVKVMQGRWSTDH